jgi:hypothetical protein
MFAFTEHGKKPLSPTDSLIGAAICALVACWFLARALNPRWRIGRGPVSPLICLAWALAALLWSITLLAHGLHYTPIESLTPWLVGGAFAVVMIATVWGIIRNPKQ